MSLSIEALNSAGQIVLGGCASVAGNLASQPAYNLTRFLQLGIKRQKISVRTLYKGIGPMCAVDFIAFGTLYSINGTFSKYPQPGPSILAGIFSVPATVVGEAFAINCLINGLSCSQSLRSSFRLAGFTTTFLRDAPYPYIVFCVTPFLQRKVEKLVPLTALTSQIFAGAIAGSVCGLLTAPFDLLKTRIQASKSSVSLRTAWDEVAKGGFRAFFNGAGLRTLQLGLFGVVVHLVNERGPDYFPASLRKDGC